MFQHLMRNLKKIKVDNAPERSYPVYCEECLYKFEEGDIAAKLVDPKESKKEPHKRTPRAIYCTKCILEVIAQRKEQEQETFGVEGVVINYPGHPFRI